MSAGFTVNIPTCTAWMRLRSTRCASTVRVVTTVEQSKALNARKGPMVIVSASGMATGGRVLHHLIAFAPDPRNAIVLCGYQAGGTRGAALADGAKMVRIYGQEVPVNAEVVQLAAGSAHADADEMLAWLRSAPRQPREGVRHPRRTRCRRCLATADRARTRMGRARSRLSGKGRTAPRMNDEGGRLMGPSPLP